MKQIGMEKKKVDMKHPFPDIIQMGNFLATAEREEGRLKDEMRRLRVEREDLKEKMNIYEVGLNCKICCTCVNSFDISRTPYSRQTSGPTI